jgi:hypothetical protein
MRYLGFSNHEKGAPRQEISKWSTVCSKFSRSGWSVVRSASLAKGDTSKTISSPHLHIVPTRSNKLSPRTLQTSLVCNLRDLVPIAVTLNSMRTGLRHCPPFQVNTHFSICVMEQSHRWRKPNGTVGIYCKHYITIRVNTYITDSSQVNRSMCLFTASLVKSQPEWTGNGMWHIGVSLIM